MNETTISLALCTLLAACSGSLPHAAPNFASTEACQGGAVHDDAALASYSPCASIRGDLTIDGVTTVKPLANLHRVEGTLTIERTTELYSLVGLESLRQVTELHLQYNRALINAGGLNGVERAERVLLSHNPQLSRRFGLLTGLSIDPTRMSVVKNAGLAAEGIAAAGPTNTGAL